MESLFSSPSDMYGQTFFARHQLWQPDYIQIAKLLAECCEFRSVLDLGCGNGYVLSHLRSLGKTVLGVDGSRHAFDPTLCDLPEESKLIWDLRQPLKLGHYDLVICMEVGEHLAELFADTLVETILEHSPNVVFFSAATPGQHGRYHVNEQPASFWLQKFSSRCYELDAPVTDRTRSFLDERLRHVRWFARNALIIRRKLAQSSEELS